MYKSYSLKDNITKVKNAYSCTTTCSHDKM